MQNLDDDGSTRISNLSLVELGEKLYLWRNYTTIPALMVLLLFASPTARSATLGTLLILIGTLLRIYTVAFMGEDTKDSPHDSELVVSGPFAIIRNPLFLANLVMTLGTLCYANVVWLALPLLLFFLFQYHCVVKYEEHTLLSRYGDEYQRYMDRVPAWIPLRMPTKDDFPVPLSFAQAVHDERKALGMVGVLLFLLMLAAR